MIELNAQVRLNEAQQPYDGGRVLIHCDDEGAREAGFRQVEVILNASTDEAMEQFPQIRTEMEGRTFRVTIEEVSP